MSKFMNDSIKQIAVDTNHRDATNREQAVITAYTHRLTGNRACFYQYAEEIMERPINDSEFDDDRLWIELKKRSVKEYAEVKESLGGRIICYIGEIIDDNWGRVIM